jgi:hypothetical protein
VTSSQDLLHLVAQLEAVIDKLPLGDRSFARDLCATFHQRGGLSPRQVLWIERSLLLHRAKHPRRRQRRQPRAAPR